MPSFVVDPILSTMPDEDADAGEMRRFLKALEAWLVAVEESPFTWKHLFACTAALQEIGRFPTFDRLRAAQRIAKTEINIGGIHKRLARFFQDEARDLLAETTTKCVLVEAPRPAITPPELLDRNLPEASVPFAEGLLCLACDRAAGVPFARAAHVVTLPFGQQTLEVAIECTIEEIDPDEMSARLGSTRVAQRLPALFSPGDLAQFNYDALVAGGEERVSETVLVIAARTYPGVPLLPLSIGSQLWRSLGRSGILENRFAVEKLLKIAAALVAGRLTEVNASRHEIRESLAGGSPQRTRERDDAKAWRLNVTREGAGYRLQYWHTLPRHQRTEQIELANVLRETDGVVIPED